MSLSTGQPIANPLLYSIADAMRTTGLSRSSIYDLIASGELVTCHFGRAVRITCESLRAVITRRTEPALERKARSKTRALLEKAHDARRKSGLDQAVAAK
jgi:predicted DNA-binding transcriptional regulator AlpA